MEDAENIDVAVVLHEVGDPVVTVEQYAYVARRRRVAVSNLWKSCEVLRSKRWASSVQVISAMSGCAVPSLYLR